MRWIPAGTGHELSIEDDKTAARNNRDETLRSIPTVAKKTQVWEDLGSALTFLHQHELGVGETAEHWFLHSLLVPQSLLVTVWPDKA